MMYHLINSRINKIATRTRLWMIFGTLAMLTISVANAQLLKEVQPMGDWAEYAKVRFEGQPITVHLRTGYESAVIFPEPVTLLSVNNRAVNSGTAAALPNCRIEIDTEVLGFSPLQGFDKQSVFVRGDTTGATYRLIVHSSQYGKRQPIQVLK